MNPKTLIKFVVLMAVVASAILLVRWGLTSLVSKGDDENTTHVQIETVQRAMFVARIRERGDLEALEVVEIKSDVAGVIKELYVEDGDTVQEGQALFKIDDEYITQRLKAAQADYEVAEGQVEQARINAELEIRRIESSIEAARKGEQLAEANLKATIAMGEQQILQAESALRKLRTDTKDQYEAEIERAHLSLKKAQLNAEVKSAALKLAESEAARFDQLYQREFVSQSQYESAQKQLHEARATDAGAVEDVKVAELSVRLAKKSLEQLTEDIADHEQSLEKLKLAMAAQQVEAQLRTEQQNSELESLLDSVDDQQKSAQIAIQSTEKYLERAKADLSRLQQELSWTIKHAPRDGTITDCEIKVGQAVASGRSEWGGGQPVMKISDLSQMIVKAYVNEIEISKVRQGLRAEIHVSAYRDRGFDGKVWKIAPAAKLKDNIRSFEVTVILTSVFKELRPQMTADVDIIVSERDNVLQMPISALIEKDATLVYARIPEREIGSFKADQRLSLKLPNHEELFSSQVVDIPEEIRHFDDRALFEVRLRVDDNPDEFQWGPPIPMDLFLSEAQVIREIVCVVHKEREPYALFIPEDAPLPGDSSLLETEEVRLELGERNDNNVEIVRGLEEGDRVRVPELSRKDLFMWED